MSIICFSFLGARGPIIVTSKSIWRSSRTASCHSNGQAGTERDRARQVVFRRFCLTRDPFLGPPAFQEPCVSQMSEMVTMLIF